MNTWVIPKVPYLSTIPLLKNRTDIRTLGYVATRYTNKPIDDVLKEIWTYAN
jgi:hypothetical protein